MKIEKRVIDSNRYELICENEKNEKFQIYYAGSDLYWVMSDYHNNNSFSVTNLEETFYLNLQQLFNLLKDNNSQYQEIFSNNCFEWLSESYGLEENANKLLIKQENNCFYIEFIRNKDNFSPMNNCSICFCLSGSKNQKIANLFSLMFLEYQNYSINNIKPKVLMK